MWGRVIMPTMQSQIITKELIKMDQATTGTLGCFALVLSPLFGAMLFGWYGFFGGLILGFVLLCVALNSSTGPSDGSIELMNFGPCNPQFFCPHCQTKGNVRIKAVSKKKGISGAKATGAVITGGMSVLATGLSRSENLTQAHCDNCKSTWTF